MDATDVGEATVTGVPITNSIECPNPKIRREESVVGEQGRFPHRVRVPEGIDPG